MQNNPIDLPQYLYLEHLEVIKDIRFTKREMDVIASTVCGRSSTLSVFLSISPKTVSAHISNILPKIRGNSREDIIHFVEHTHQYVFVQQYYKSLIIYRFFEKHLIKIKHLIKDKMLSFVIIYNEEFSQQKNILLEELKKHLSHIGITPEFKIEDIHNLVFETKSYQARSIIYLSSDPKVTTEERQKIRIPFVDLSRPKSYYSYFFEVLATLYPDVNFEEVIEDFEKQHTSLCNFQIPAHPNIEYTQTKILEKKQDLYYQLLSWVQKNQIKSICTIIVAIFCLSAFTFFLFNKNTNQLTIKSDFPLPRKEAFLKRPYLISQIENKLKGTNNIKTATLVGVIGIGGAGKTTLARYYARFHPASVSWEINAETKESLFSSFKDLAYALATSKELKDDLKYIQEIQNSEEREKQIIEFVKKQLKQRSNWILIYDNVENSRDTKTYDIKTYLPNNPEVWGYGKVIITTRDNNFQNNSYIEPNHVVRVDQLTGEESLDLFSKIYYGCKSTELTQSQKEKTLTFLSNIPPFPLDISVAAYYIKDAKISFDTYLENVSHYHNNFDKIQKNIIKEKSYYDKTRYGIISLSFEKLINSNPDFKDLLFLICLLDSQNIPQPLFSLCKNNLIVTAFIHELMKQSFITINEISLSDKTKEQVFSIHRSVQQIGLDYLKNSQQISPILIQSVSDAFLKYIKTIDKKDYNACTLFPKNHGEVFLTHKNILTKEMYAFISSELGGIFYKVRNLTKAKKLLENSIDYFSNTPQMLLEYPQSLVYLGSIYNMLADYKKAKILIEQGLSIYEKHYPQKKSQIVWTLVYLSRIGGELGNYEKRKALLEKSLTMCEKNNLETSLTVWVKSILGSVYIHLGQYLKAKKILEENLKYYRYHYNGQYNAKAAETFKDLGKLYMKFGFYEEGKKLIEQSASIINNMYPKDHPYIAYSLINLGIAHIMLGSYEEARRLIDKSLTIYNKHYDENDFYSAYIKQQLGIIHRELGQHDKAKEVFETSFAIIQQHHGFNNYRVGLALKHFGLLYSATKDFPKAEVFLNKALRNLQENDHPESFSCFENLADLYFTKANMSLDINEQKTFREQAVGYLKQALKIIEDKFPRNSPHLTKIQTKLVSSR